MVKVLELCQFLIKTVHLQVGGMRSWGDKSYYGHCPDSLSASAVCRSCLWTWTPSRRPCSPWPAPPLWRAPESWRTRTGLWWSSLEWCTFRQCPFKPLYKCDPHSQAKWAVYLPSWQHFYSHSQCFPLFFKAFMITFTLFQPFQEAQSWENEAWQGAGAEASSQKEKRFSARNKKTHKPQ